MIREEYVPAELAPILERAGATALSVLTEEEFFLGSLGDLKEAKKVTQIPILRKDFIFDPWQIWEARAAGADAFLLIAAVLGDGIFANFSNWAARSRMEPLVEVHSRAELNRTIAAGAKIIGVNNRDLRDFAVRLETSLESHRSDSGRLHRRKRIGTAHARGPRPTPRCRFRRFPYR